MLKGSAVIVRVLMGVGFSVVVCSAAACGPCAGKAGAELEACESTVQSPGADLPVPADCSVAVHVGDVSVGDNAGLDALTGVTHLHGVLQIAGDVSDLSALRCLTYVQGLDVLFTPLVTLSLDGLREVEGPVSVQSIGTLESVSLPVLANISGALFVGGNDLLQEVSLPALVSVGGETRFSVAFQALWSLRRADLGSLTEVASGLLVDRVGTMQQESLALNFGSLTTVGGELSVWSADNLVDMGGFMAVQTIGANVDVQGSAKLESFSLPALTSVGGILSFSGSPALEAVSLPELMSVGAMDSYSVVFQALGFLRSVELSRLTEIPYELLLDRLGATQQEPLVLDFGSLTRVEGGLRLWSAANLRTLDGFSSLQSVGGLEILTNSMLPTCQATEFADRIGAAAPVISGNASDDCTDR